MHSASYCSQRLFIQCLQTEVLIRHDFTFFNVFIVVGKFFYIICLCICQAIKQSTVKKSNYPLRVGGGNFPFCLAVWLRTLLLKRMSCTMTCLSAHEFFTEITLMMLEASSESGSTAWGFAMIRHAFASNSCRTQRTFRRQYTQRVRTNDWVRLYVPPNTL